MAGKNDFLPFAVNGDANVATQAEYAGSEEQLKGMQPGLASSKLCNKVWRQASLMAAALGELIRSQNGNAFDNGDTDSLKAELTEAVRKITANVVSAGNAIDITDGADGARVIGVTPSALHTIYSGTATDSEISALIQPGDLYIREG